MVSFLETLWSKNLNLTGVDRKEKNYHGEKDRDINTVHTG
jgi:hypothetical protein